MSEDFPAFIVNRILLPMINEAVYTLHEGIGSVEAIDTAMRLGANHPMGPLQLADFIGLDTCLAVMQVLHEGLADSKYRPCPLARQNTSRPAGSGEKHSAASTITGAKSRFRRAERAARFRKLWVGSAPHIIVCGGMTARVPRRGEGFTISSSRM